jgi:ATP-dependent helicase/DNAse subunit B
MLSVVKELKERREQQEKERAENLTQEFIEIAEEFITVYGKLFECLGFFAVVKFKQLKEKTCAVLDKAVDALIELGEQ